MWRLLLTFLLFPLLVLTSCDAFTGPDAVDLDNPAFDVYEIVLVGNVPTAVIRIGLTLEPIESEQPDGQPHLGGVYEGEWELVRGDEHFPVEGGAVRGYLGPRGINFGLFLFPEPFDGPITDQGVLYSLAGIRSPDGELDGDWRRIGTSLSGGLRGELVREATEAAP